MEESKINNILNHFINFNIIEFKPKQQYEDIYNNYDSKIKPYFVYFHQRLDELLKYMNDRVSNGHYTANESRELIAVIEQIQELKLSLRNSNYAFTLDAEYQQCIDFCYTFLSSSGGSQIPREYKKILLKRYEPIFKINDELIIKKDGIQVEKTSLKMVGSGAYATVYSFIEPLTNKKFAMKRLHKDIAGKELERFKLEFKKMNDISNPYILKAYSYNENDNSYIMEYCDFTLRKYILTNNSKDFMTFSHRKNIALQFLRGLQYLHNKELLHRDVSFNNILLRVYDDNFVVVKISDFGLVKDLNIDMTRTDSEIRGTIIDDTLTSFKDYNIKNEIYAIGVVLWFIFTGKTNLSIDDSNIGKIVNKCITRNHSERFENANEIIHSLMQAKEYVSDMSNTLTHNQSIKIDEINEKSGLNIDEKAFTILRAMVEDNSNNQLYYLKTLSGEHLQTSGGNFNVNIDDFTPRERTSWRNALRQLIDNGLIIAINHKNDVFEVTSEGYKFYDLKNEAFVVQVV